MGSIFLVTTEPDYDGFSIIEAHLTADDAAARVAAANKHADSAPEFPKDDSDAEYARWDAELEAWRKAHPFGYEVSGGYVQERYRLMQIAIGPSDKEGAHHG